jgi:alcohol dehydrogenase class IV
MIWTVKKGAYRVFQAIMKVAGFVLPIRVPELLIGGGSVKKLAKTVKKRDLSHVLVVTDKVLTGLGLARGMLDSLSENGIDVTVFDDVQPNPTIGNIEAGLKCYIDSGCQGIIAFGGGSPMDCAKMIGALASNPKSTVLKMRGMFRVWRKPPPIFAVPTTAGTGSEATLAAVVSNLETHEKFAIIDFKLVPQVAVLDPELMLGLPLDITAATGMDALTHAIEAYIGLHGTRFCNAKAEEAVKIIFKDLEAVCRDGSDLARRENMALASFHAGVAFTRASVGYVHAVAHNLGGLYGVPHGLANAVVLPYVL